jgi:nitrite reductase/ring-hydroxylating ferredoxin subunit
MSDDNRPGIPNGWYAVGWSKDLSEGDVERIRYFGEELVLFRTRTGEARVLSAYCSHLGAHLAEGGRVIGESVRCPFHGWQYDGLSGAVVEIPYCKRIPEKARVRPWQVCERNHMIFVWHHADEKPPEWEIPVVSQLEDPAWTPIRTFELEVPVHMQDMAENNMDPVHFQYVHQMMETPPTEISYHEDGRLLRATSYTHQETPIGEFDMALLRDSWCLGMSSVESSGIPGVGLYMFSSTSPIDEGNTISRWALTATRNAVDVAGEEWFNGITKGVMDDWQIWTNKIHRADPVFCEEDKLLVEFRRWAKQFYSESQLAAP